jgi:hypothetical protein
MSYHDEEPEGSRHPVPNKTYASTAARDADTAYQIAANVDTEVRVNTTPPSYYKLASIGPTVWVSAGDGGGSGFGFTVTAEAYLRDNTTETVIPAANALVIVDGTGWTGEQESEIIVNDDGSIEYTGVDQKTVAVDGNITLSPAIGSSKKLLARFGDMHFPARIVTFSNATNTVNEITTPRANGDTITFFNTPGTMPTGLRDDIFYYVVNKMDDSFQLSYTLGGPAITFTDDGSGTNQYCVAGLHGSETKKVISATTPDDLLPKSTTPFNTGDMQFLLVANTEDTTNILVSDAYIRVIG